MSREPLGETVLTWRCDRCEARVELARRLRMGESAAEQAAANSDDLQALMKRSHDHEPHSTK